VQGLSISQYFALANIAKLKPSILQARESEYKPMTCRARHEIDDQTKAER
jgi:hypothetical protein